MRHTPYIAALAVALASAGPLNAGVAEFHPYAAFAVDRLVIGIEQLEEAIEEGDLDEAKAAWIAARPAWETGETFLGEFFPDADVAMDSWPDATGGFHAIEHALFGQGDLDKAMELVEELEKNSVMLKQQFTETALTAQGLLNGTAGIAFEIGEEKLSGGESAASGTSLADMKNNAEGIAVTYALAFAPDLAEKAPDLHETIVRQIIALEAALAVDKLAELDHEAVLALSGKLALSLSDAAGPLGLEAPTIGG